jgi:hypothetical protein
VWGALPPQAAELLGWQQGDDWAEPQLLLKFPDDEQPWPLSRTSTSFRRGRVERGSTAASSASRSRPAPRGRRALWCGRDPIAPAGGRTARHHAGRALGSCARGDALVMHPQLGHSGSLNLGSTIRSAIYFRLLTDAP